MDLEITANPFNIDLNDLFGLAARINKKRSFLFVSKVLGKHIPANPKSVINIGKMLGRLYAYNRYNINFDLIEKQDQLSLVDINKDIDRVELPEENIIIGFAETATALGHSVFDAFTNAKYIHTTREELDTEPLLEFVEEHSHATGHTVFTDDKEFFNNDAPVILVDDEITTGKTALNIIEQMHEKCPRKYYSILTILDWRSEEHIERYRDVEKKLGIKIDVFSLISGNVKDYGKANLSDDIYTEHDAGNDIQVAEYSFDKYFQVINGNYIKYTGRFGIHSDLHDDLDGIARKIADDLKENNKNYLDEKTLFLGVGEFMFVPLKIASNFSDKTVYHSSTRSPILARDLNDYAIKNKFRLHNIYNDNIYEFVYNIPANHYDSLYIFYERYSSEAEINKIKEKLKQLGIKKINICYMLSNKF
jgi:pyrimidine operon attenuation protein/uracil phosphoribosyltransferase